MTQAEKLEALIHEAAVSGWVYPGKEIGLDLDRDMRFSDNRMIWTGDDYWPWQELLFNHDFARALFGEKMTCVESGKPASNECCTMALDWANGMELPAYNYHLQQAVILDDPIDYMYKAVFEGDAK